MIDQYGLMAVLDAMPDAVIGIGEDRTIRLANCSVEKIWGYSRDNLIGKRVDFLLCDSESSESRNVLSQLMGENNGASETNSKKMMAKKDDGSIFPISASLRSLPGVEDVNYIFVAKDITLEEINEKETQALLLKLQKIHEERKTLAHRVLAEREETTRQLALDIHDDLGGRLTALKMVIDTLDDNSNLANIREALVSDVRGITDAVRRFSRELRPAALDDFGLVDALMLLVKSYTEASGIPVHSEFAGIRRNDRFDIQVETALYRIAQEALTNAARHSRASKVEMKLYRRNDSVLISIADDGDGFDTELRAAFEPLSVGLSGMKDRAVLMGGALSVVSENGAGTWVVAELPVITHE